MHTEGEHPQSAPDRHSATRVHIVRSPSVWVTTGGEPWAKPTLGRRIRRTVLGTLPRETPAALHGKTGRTEKGALGQGSACTQGRHRRAPGSRRLNRESS